LDLEGERDSVVLTCKNCETAWEALNGKFSRVKLSVVPGLDEKAVYLPFWKISASAKHIEINSFADFIRATNQPIVVDKDRKNQGMNFWSPAFKIRPKIFLRLLKQVTISQNQFRHKDIISNKKLYPVTLPQTEAAQSLKLTLAGSAFNKKTGFSPSSIRWV